MSLELNDLRVLLPLRQSNMVGQPTSMGYTIDLYVFSDGSTLCRTAALIAKMPCIISQRFQGALDLFISPLFITELRQFCNGLVVEYFEQLKPFSSYLTRNSKELEQNKASIIHHLIYQQNMYKLNI